MNERDGEKYKKPLILIAEDIPQNMEVVCNMLIKEGYRVAMAGNGKQALEMAPAVRPDLILLDIMMPEVDGFEVCRLLKKDPITKDIPVIFLTAKADTIDVVEGFEIGAMDYVTKPFKGAELLSRVKTHLELKSSREALKELNVAKDKIFSIIAHDLRDLLQLLILSADLLHNDYDTFDEAKRRDYIRKFLNGSKQMADLLENLLEWARSQSGSLENHPENVDIDELVTECLELAKGNAQKKNIRLFSFIQPGIYAVADRNMLRTVLRNLISNALKFTHPGGEVKVSASPSTSPAGIEISVSDNGVGMSAEDVAGLFCLEVKKIDWGTARVKKNARGTANEKGTGLGLILCKEFVEKNKGTIEVSSELGKGSCFKVTLPAPYGMST